MGPIGWQEMILILVVLLLLFGAKRLPEMGRSLGRGMREFKDAVTGKDEDELEKAELTPPPAPAKPQVSEEAKPKPQSERVSSS
jgi:sec-independent protein translocase protein TatA